MARTRRPTGSPESAARVAVVMTWMDWLRRTEGEEA